MVNYKKFEKDNKKKEVKGSAEFDMRLTKYKFFDENCFRGVNINIPGLLKKVQFHHNLNHRIEQKISLTERKITFDFLLEMRPDLGEISFKGECIFESPQQDKIDFLLAKIPKSVVNNLIIVKEITKNCFANASRIAKRNGLPFPPPNILSL